MPPNWQLAPGVSRPDISASHLRRDKNWVANGSGWYVIYDGDRRWALELAIHIRLFSNNPIPHTSDTHWVNGHTANLAWKTKRRGLPWKRHDVTFMILDFVCQYSERRIQLEFSGWCPQEGFAEILESMRHLRCH
ncbi:MAG: hypothetical protein JSV61_08025 [Anaerolineales bacterium]|nr:MAG: hypothetical protein JSV61_08025 [Anaerolineales bacterium]